MPPGKLIFIFSIMICFLFIPSFLCFFVFNSFLTSLELNILYYFISPLCWLVSLYISSVHSLRCVWLFATPWITACWASLSITNSWSSLKLTSIKSVMPSIHLILCRPFSSCPQSLLASESFPMSQLFAWGGQSIGLSASVLPMNSQEFRTDFLN